MWAILMRSRSGVRETAAAVLPDLIDIHILSGGIPEIRERRWSIRSV